MSLKDDLLQLETGFWQAAGNGDFYHKHFADDGFVVFQEPAGVMNKEQTIETVNVAGPWSSFDFQNVRLVQLTDESASLVYRATGQRADEAEQAMLVTSVYAIRDGNWKLTVHSQIPVSVHQ